MPIIYNGEYVKRNDSQFQDYLDTVDKDFNNITGTTQSFQSNSKYYVYTNSDTIIVDQDFILTSIICNVQGSDAAGVRTQISAQAFINGIRVCAVGATVDPPSSQRNSIEMNIPNWKIKKGTEIDFQLSLGIPDSTGSIIFIGYV
jgi:hypothetical protein